jgi:hypothetical protein
MCRDCPTYRTQARTIAHRLLTDLVVLPIALFVVVVGIVFLGYGGLPS